MRNPGVSLPHSSDTLRFTAIVIVCSAFLGIPHALAQRVVNDPDIHARFNYPPPATLRNGTATLDQVKGWMYRESHPGFPSEGVSAPADVEWLTTAIDLDLDGMTDLLLADLSRSGSGGEVYSAFLSTDDGYRLIGTFLAKTFVPVSDNDVDRQRFVVRQNLGSADVLLTLAELEADGLHKVAEIRMNTLDPEKQRQINELYGAGSSASASALSAIFPE